MALDTILVQLKDNFHMVVLKNTILTRGPKGHITYTWAQCATFFDGLARVAIFIYFSDKHKLVRGHWDLASYQVSLNSIQQFQRKSQNMYQPVRGQGGHFVFLIGPKNTHLVEGVEILLSVKFRWIPFSDFRGEVENVSAKHRPGRPPCFSDLPEKHKLGRGRWDLASCQVSLNSVQWFQRSRKCLSKSEARAAILFFRSARKTQTW